MTLSLEDVQNIRFPISKRVGDGYRATEVDDFVDQVDATFSTLLAENERLNTQLSGLHADHSGAPATGDAAAQGHAVDATVADLRSENERLRSELEQARSQSAQAAPADDAEVGRLREENAALRSQLEASRTELEQARQAPAPALVETDAATGTKVERIEVSTAAQASPAVTRLVQLATEQAESVVAEAQQQADRTVEEANRHAQEVTSEAERRAETVQSEARTSADELSTRAQAEAARLTAQAQATADQVNTEAAARRRELFGELEDERDALLDRVDGLRQFESNYRENIARHLREQLATVESQQFEPAEAPQLLSAADRQVGSTATSSTPRLDALLAEGN